MHVILFLGIRECSAFSCVTFGFFFKLTWIVKLLWFLTPLIWKFYDSLVALYFLKRLGLGIRNSRFRVNFYGRQARFLVSGSFLLQAGNARLIFVCILNLSLGIRRLRYLLDRLNFVAIKHTA